MKFNMYEKDYTNMTVRYFSEMQHCANIWKTIIHLNNILKEKYHMIISNDTENLFEKVQYPFLNAALSELW